MEATLFARVHQLLDASVPFFAGGASSLGRFSTGTAIAGRDPFGRPTADIRFRSSLRGATARLARFTGGVLTEVHSFRRVASWGNDFLAKNRRLLQVFRKLLNVLWETFFSSSCFDNKRSG